MPVVIYLHGNSSCRLEGLRMAPELLKRDINVFVFDFAGCGMSEGEYISLGWHEKDDLRIIIDFVEKIPGVSKIGVWGNNIFLLIKKKNFYYNKLQEKKYKN